MSEAEQLVSAQVLLGDAGCSPSVEWKGKRYTLGHPTERADAIYSDALIEAERRGIEAQLAKKLITAAKYDEKIDALGRAIDGLEHEEGGAVWLRYRTGKEAAVGMKLYLWSLFAQHHPELTVADVEALSDSDPSFVKLALRRVAPGFFSPLARLLKFTPEQTAELERAILEQLDRVLPAAPTSTPS